MNVAKLNFLKSEILGLDFGSSFLQLFNTKQTWTNFKGAIALKTIFVTNRPLSNVEFNVKINLYGIQNVYD